MLLSRDPMCSLVFMVNCAKFNEVLSFCITFTYLYYINQLQTHVQWQCVVVIFYLHNYNRLNTMFFVCLHEDGVFAPH